MNEKNEKVVRRLMDEVWGKGNLNLVDEFFATDHVNHDPLNNGRGPDVIKDDVRKYRTAFPDCRLDIDEILTSGNNVIVRWHYSGTHKNALEGIPPTGRHVTGPGMTIHRFDGDKIKETFTNWDALGLMQQLGVVTLPGKSMRAGT